MTTSCSAGLPALRRQACVLLVGLFAPVLAHAQAAPKNLRVLPKDTPAPQVVAQMQQFTRALGVQCAYCHIEQSAPLLSVEEQLAAQAAAAAAQAAQAQNPQAAQAAGRGRGRGRGPQGPQMDFAADDKRTKSVARVMMSMVKDVNAKYAVRLECATCHRGVAIPAQLSDLLRQTMLGKGEGAAVVQYRELRQQYISTGAYDFRETTLLDLGRDALGTRKPDDALAWLQLNVEFYPRSAPSFIELAKAHLAKRDRESAVADLTRALAIDPSNVDASRELARLKNQLAPRSNRLVIPH